MRCGSGQDGGRPGSTAAASVRLLICRRATCFRSCL